MAEESVTRASPIASRSNSTPMLTPTIRRSARRTTRATHRQSRCDPELRHERKYRRSHHVRNKPGDAACEPGGWISHGADRIHHRRAHPVRLATFCFSVLPAGDHRRPYRYLRVLALVSISSTLLQLWRTLATTAADSAYVGFTGGDRLLPARPTTFSAGTSPPHSGQTITQTNLPPNTFTTYNFGSYSTR